VESAAEAAVAQAGGDSNGIAAQSVLHLGEKDDEEGARAAALHHMQVLRRQIRDTDATAAGPYATSIAHNRFAETIITEEEEEEEKILYHKGQKIRPFSSDNFWDTLDHFGANLGEFGLNKPFPATNY